MSWHAIESVDDAIDATRSFLFPVALGAWLKLAVITLFVGVGGGGVSTVTNVANLPTSLPPEAVDAGAPDQLPATFPTEPWLIGGIVAVAVVVGLAVRVLSETLRFVFYDALRSQTVRLREPARQRLGQALRLFGFKLLVGAVLVLPFVVGGLVLWTVGVDAIGEMGLFAAVVAGTLAAGVAFVLYLLVVRGTNEFVVPLMVVSDCGVRAGWRRLWPVVRSQPAQFVVYIVVHFLLLLAISIGQSIIGALVFGIVGTVGAMVGLVAVAAFGGLSAALASTAGTVSIAALVAVTLLVAFVVYLPVSIVVLTYVISYEVSVLEAADAEFQLFPVSSDPETEPTAAS